MLPFVFGVIVAERKAGYAPCDHRIALSEKGSGDDNA
jgi:hypothetical protein